MIEHQSQLAKPADWFAKDAKLCEHRGTVVVNALASQLIVAIDQVCWGELWRSQTLVKARERDVYGRARLGLVAKGQRSSRKAATSRLSPASSPPAKPDSCA